MPVNFKKLLTVQNLFKALTFGKAVKDIATDKSKSKTEKVNDGAQVAGVVLGIEVNQAKVEILTARIAHVETELRTLYAELAALVADLQRSRQ